MRMQWCGHGRDNTDVRTHLVFVIRSYRNKTLFFATRDSDEHYSMDATVALLYVEQVTAVLSLYLHVAGNYDRILENNSGNNTTRDDTCRHINFHVVTVAECNEC